LKEDSCHASGDHDAAFKQYGLMRDGLNATGRPIVFSLCGWNAWYAPVGKSLGNLWRTGPDDSNWNGVIKNIDILAPLSADAGPGGWNDPCLLLSQDWSGKMIMTELQIKAQFSMWAVVSAPLLISGSVINMTPETLATYSNKKVIAVNQVRSASASFLPRVARCVIRTYWNHLNLRRIHWEKVAPAWRVQTCPHAMARARTAPTSGQSHCRQKRPQWSSSTLATRRPRSAVTLLA
jgi:hypothetical protein